MIVKCLPVDIYESKDKHNCSNNGISARYKEILLICKHGFISVDTDDPPDNLCKVVTKQYTFGTFTHVEPVAKPNGCGWMFGGQIVYTSDSRFGDKPLKLFDRCEKQEDYDLSFD